MVCCDFARIGWYLVSMHSAHGKELRECTRVCPKHVYVGQGPEMHAESDSQALQEFVISPQCIGDACEVSENTLGAMLAPATTYRGAP